MRLSAGPQKLPSALTAAEIYLSTRLRVFSLSPGSQPCATAAVATAAKNLESLGFCFSQELFENLCLAEVSAVTAQCELLISELRKMVGSDRPYRPMYPNFPAQVMEARDIELFMNAMAHYWGSIVSDIAGDPSLVVLPQFPKHKRARLIDEATAPRVIGLGSQEDFDGIFTALVGSNGSLSEYDKAVVRWFINRGEFKRLLPESIPQKENLAVVIGAALSAGGGESLCGYLKTSTDVLRVAVAMSQGDVSLASSARFKAFSRAERRFFLSALEDAPNLAEDMLRWKERWKRLGERLHPGEYAKRFPKALAAFAALRNDEHINTFNGRVERALNERSLDKAIALAEQRPGVFARRLDHLLRLGAGQATIERFLAVAPQVSTPVLIQLHAHFKHRHSGFGPRAFFPKGSVAKMQVSDRSLPPLPMDTTLGIARAVGDVLIDRFRTRPSLGSVWIDPALEQCTVPFSQRSAAKTLRTISRGSRLDLPEAHAYRFFLWWKNGRDRTDIDLSAAFYGSAFNMLSQVAYYNLREFGCYHSGDITSAPQGACEFIDVDARLLAKKGVRYVALVLNSFTRQPYCDLPECFAGWMARRKPQSGEVFEARTVQDRFDLSADTTVCVPLVFDLSQRKAIWCDLSLRSGACINNVHSNRANLAQMVQAISSLRKPNLYELFLMHARARGRLVPREEAETVFSMHEGITPFDIDTILSQYLT